MKEKTKQISQERVDESRRLVRKALDMAEGYYCKIEPQYRDSWRDQELWQLLAHIKHEIKEIERSGTIEKQLHNALDLTALGAILSAWFLLRDKGGDEK